LSAPTNPVLGSLYSLLSRSVLKLIPQIKVGKLGVSFDPLP
jgi:hypothetical protein